MVFLDEFGHIGPFVSKNHEKYKTSPIFGVSGFILDVDQVRDLAHWFHKLKEATFERDIELAGANSSVWEKKGNSLFTSGRVHKNKRLGYALINNIKQRRGKIFYHGVVKDMTPDRSKPTGLYATVLSHAIREIERYFSTKSSNYLIVMDEHGSRTRLLEGAMKTMFSREKPAKRLVEPPYHVESHLYGTIQMADWVSSIIGPLLTHQEFPVEYAEMEWATKYFKTRVDAASTHSKIHKRTARYVHYGPDGKKTFKSDS